MAQNFSGEYLCGSHVLVNPDISLKENEIVIDDLTVALTGTATIKVYFAGGPVVYWADASGGLIPRRDDLIRGGGTDRSLVMDVAGSGTVRIVGWYHFELLGGTNTEHERPV